MRSKILALVVLLGLVVLWFVKNPPNITAKEILSGTVNINGVVPPGATVSVAVRKVNTAQFDVVVSGITAVDGATWSWSGAETGISYELQGSLVANGTTVSQSDIVSVAAPATEELLTFNITSASNNQGTISGVVDINGVVPVGATVNIGERIKGQETIYSVAVSGLSAVDGVKWEWNGARQGVIYEMKAFLKLNNSNVAESKNTLTVASPATNEVVTINLPVPTQTIAVPTPGSISGTINLNGSVPAGSSIVVAERTTGQSQFTTVITGLAGTNGVSWNWTGATAGVSYDMQAYLQVNGNTIASSGVVTHTAPAANEVLTINAYANLPTPQYSPGVACVGQNSNGAWNANVSYHSVNGAANYWIQITDTNNNMIFNSQIPPNNQQLPTTYNFNTNYLFSTGATYFAKYAYSPCGSCTDAGSYSPFTPTNQFSCTVATVTPYPTYTPYPTNTIPPNPPTSTPVPPKPTNTPIPPSPTLPPRTSACNQSCGGNGYTCVQGLQCVSGAMPGSSLCRNPNCTDKTDCKCV